MRTPWLLGDVEPTSERVRVFCFPYAGGAPSAYLAWRNAATPLDVQPVRLPGRPGHGNDGRFRSIDELVDRTVEGLVPFLECSFALFGHSMGALVAFEAARRLERRGHAPARVIVSGRVPPFVPASAAGAGDLSDERLVEVVRRNSGPGPAAVLDHAALSKLFLPALRADMELCDTYSFVAAPALGCPLSTFYGDRQKRAPLMEGWRTLTTGPWSCHRFAGGHFFPFDESRDAVLGEVVSLLAGAGG